MAGAADRSNARAKSARFTGLSLGSRRGAELEDRLDPPDVLAGQAQVVEVASIPGEVAPEHRSAQRDQTVDHGGGDAGGIAEGGHGHEAARHILGDVLVVHRRRRRRPLVRARRRVGEALEGLGERVAAEPIGVEQPAVDAGHAHAERPRDAEPLGADRLQELAGAGPGALGIEAVAVAPGPASSRPALATMLATCRIALALLSPVQSVLGAATAWGKIGASLASPAGPRGAGSAATWSHSFLMVMRMDVGRGQERENG